MNKFSEALAAANEALLGGNLAGDFKSVQRGLVELLSRNGPDPAHKDKLKAFYIQLDKAIKAEKAKKTETTTKAKAKAIVDAAGAALQKPQRAATLKMLSHLYHQSNIGGQQIWVYSPPKIYTKWIFDELAGADDTQLKAKLGQNEDEVYSSDQRAVMVNAVQTARAVAQDVMVKLGAASDTTKTVVRRYFGNAATTEAQLIAIMKALAGGYKRIAAACNAGNIIISDEPGDRSGTGWKDWAFIYTNEAMSVIYLQDAWLKMAGKVSESNLAPLYRCVRTLIHELSHKEVSTEDIVYGPKGLMPEGSAALTPDFALHNADSWAYFAMDVMGYLTGPDKTNGRTPTIAIRKTPTRALTTA